MNLVLLELSLRGWSVTTNVKARSDGSIDVYIAVGNNLRVYSARTNCQQAPVCIEAAVDELLGRVWQLCADGAPLPALVDQRKVNHVQ